MKLLFASDSFKGTITSEESAEMLSKAAEEIFGSVEWTSIPIADGGEGTTVAVIKATGGSEVEIQVHGPLMEKVTAKYGQIDKNHAVMEMAAASGLTIIPDEKRNPLNTTTYGTGEMILDALNKGFTDISIAIGGSATNDGGMGCVKALGVKFLDKNGKELDGTGSDLEKVCHIDISGIDKRIKNTKFTVMCDVKNPLYGQNGCSYTFGKQKGGTPEILDQLEKGMCNYRDVIRKDLGIDPDIEGAGAAGGLGAALMVFLNGKLKSGIETVLELCSFDKKLKDVDLVITGEGRADWQSCFGKVIQGVGDHCKKNGVPAIALVGSMGKNAEDIFEHGINSMITTVTDTITLEEALTNAKESYLSAARRLFRLVKTGMDLRK